MACDVQSVIAREGFGILAQRVRPCEMAGAATLWPTSFPKPGAPGGPSEAHPALTERLGDGKRRPKPGRTKEKI